MMKRSLVILLVLLSMNALFGQNSYTDFYASSTANNTSGMYILGGWAIANLAVGATGWARTSGSEMYFHQMNFFWNTINLGIAGFSFYSTAQMDPFSMTGQEILDNHLRIENLYLINGGLDIAYMGTGLLLRRLSMNNQKRADQLKGYGNAVLLQGGFLFLFDGVMWLVQRNHRLDFLQDLSLSALPGGAMLQMNFVF